MAQQNGVAKRMNIMLMEKARIMLSCVGMVQELWEEVVGMVCYLVNRYPLKTLVGKTLYEKWDGNNPSLEHIRVFGCEAFLHVLKSILDKKFEKCIFIGCKDGVKGYKPWNMATRKIIYSRDVIFREVEGTFKVKYDKREKEQENLEFELN